MQRQVQLLEEKYKDIAQLKNMKEQVEDLKKERVWAEVIEAEKVKTNCLLNHRLWFVFDHIQKSSHVNVTGPYAIKTTQYFLYVPSDEIILAHTGLTLYTCVVHC